MKMRIINPGGMIRKHKEPLQTSKTNTMNNTCDAEMLGKGWESIEYI
jgi:hypothetical protein